MNGPNNLNRMNKSKSRREVLELLTLAGFGVFLPSCGAESSAETVNRQIKTVLEPDTLIPEVQILEIEEVIASENVVYLSKQEEQYEMHRQGFNLNHNHHPLVIALCKNTEGVAEAVRYANSHQLDIAVKSGGHSFEGFSSNDEGLVINLSLMNLMEWEDNHQLIAQPAVLLRDLYDFILPANRLLPAGSCGTVGLAGLTLGGGYGFFARQYGLTCDHLIKATMVDGSGEIHHVKANDELMWALRGGGNGNFGIVTSLTYQTRELPTGFKRYRFQAYKLDKERAKTLLQDWFYFSAKLPVSSFSAFVLNGSTLTVLITNYAENNAQIDDMVNCLSDTMDKISIGKRKPLKDALSTYYGTQHSIYFKNSSAGYYNGYETIAGCIDSVLDIVLSNKVIYQINTLGGSIDSSEFEAGSCYPHRKLPFLCELQSYWKKDKDKVKRLSAFNKIQDILNTHGINRQYRNYPNIDFPNWETAYYGKENYAKLQRIKLKYDPDNCIRHKQSVTFASANV